MAGSKLTGDFAKLARLIERFDRAAAGEFREGMLKALGHEALTQVKLGFRQGRSPDGTPWAPLKLRTGGAPLRDRGTLGNSFSVQPYASGFSVSSAEILKFRVHQRGAVVKPKKGKALRFRGVSYVLGRSRGGKRRMKRVYGQWIFARKVVIPARPMLPTGSLGPIWTPAFEAAADRAWKRFWRRTK